MSEESENYLECFKCKRMLIQDDDYIHLDKNNNIFCRICFQDINMSEESEENISAKTN